jgi:hypothetical protein
VKQRAQLGDEAEAHDVRTMDAQKFVCVELRHERRQRLADQVHFVGGVHFDVVARRRDAPDLVDGQEKRAIRIADENLARGRGPARQLREQPAHALIEVAAVGLCERRAHAVDARAKPVTIERLQQVVERLDLERAHRVLGIRGGEYDQRRVHLAQRVDDVETAASAELDIEVQDVRLRGLYGRDPGLHRRGFRDDAKVGLLAEEPLELRACRRLVLDDHDRVGHSPAGKLTVTTTPRGSRAATVSAWSFGNNSSRRRATFESPVPGLGVGSLRPTPSSLTR